MILPENMTKCNNGQDFVLIDEHKKLNDPTTPKILGFSSPFGIELLKDCKLWQIDGTFEIAKCTMFEQVWIINVVTKNDASVPAAYFLLPDKQKTTYKKVLNCLKAKQILPPAKVYTDFELNEINSLKEVFDDVIVEGCDTHFKHALRRNLGDKHLLQDYNSYTPLQNFVRKVWGCSLVPPEMVEDIWENTLKLSLPFKEDYNPDNNQNDEAEDDDGVDPQEEINTYNHNLDQYIVYLVFLVWI